MYPAMKGALTLPLVLGKINKTLAVANQIIPLYVKVKPMITNAKDTFAVAKELIDVNRGSKTTKKIDEKPKKETVKSVPQNIVNQNNPVFFL